jgi:hypothetical protein
MDSSYDNPPPLFATVPDNDGVHTDIVKMGLMIESVNAGTFPEIAMLSELMCDKRSALRLADLESIRSILGLLQDSQVERQVMDEADAMQEGQRARDTDSAGSYGKLAYTLYALLIERQRRLGVQMDRLDEMAAVAATHETTVAEIDGHRARLEAELQERDTALVGLRERLQERDAELAGLRERLQEHDAELAALRSHTSMIEASRAWRFAHTIGTMRRKLGRTAM